MSLLAELVVRQDGDKLVTDLGPHTLEVIAEGPAREMIQPDKPVLLELIVREDSNRIFLEVLTTE